MYEEETHQLTFFTTQWMVKQVKQEEEVEKTASLKQGGIYHFRNKEGVYKTAVIFPLHKVS